MECNDVFNLASLPLMKLAAIAVAQKFWETPDVIRKMDYELAEIDRDCAARVSYSWDGSKKNFTLLSQHTIDNIFEKIDLLLIPVKLAVEIKIVVCRMWQKACYWCDVIDNLRLPGKYAKKLYWTSHGEIDKKRIILEFWLKDSEFPTGTTLTVYSQSVMEEIIEHKKYPEKFCDYQRSDDTWFRFVEHSLFCTSLIYGKEDSVSENYKKLKDELLKRPPAVSEEAFNSIDIIIAKCILVNNGNIGFRGKDDIINYILDYQSDKEPSLNEGCKLPAVSLFVNCLSYRFEFGVRYFWNKLSVNEKKYWTVHGAKWCLNSLTFGCDIWQVKGKGYDAFRAEINLKILFFFLNKMTEIEKLEFIQQNFVDILNALCTTWPYQELCDETLYPFWHHIPRLEVKFLDYFLEHFVLNYVKTMTKEKEHQEKNSYTFKSVSPMLNFASQRLFNRLLSIVMNKMSKETKEKIFIEDSFKNLQGLYYIQDHTSLKILINDFHLSEYRQKILQVGVDNHKKLIFKGNYDPVNEFFELMEFGQEELKYWKRKSNVLDVFCLSGDIISADKHLSRLTDVDSERKEMINQIDAYEISYCLIQNGKFKEADEYLSWGLETEEERNNVKKSIGSDDFIVDKIFYIWGVSKFDCESTILENVKSCTELLEFFLDPSGVLYFKEAKLKSLSEKLVESLNQIDAYEISYCLIQSGKFKEADEYLSWRLETEEDRNNVKKSIGSDDFIVDKTCYIWGVSKSDSESTILKNVESCTALLEFFLDPSGVLYFKESKLKSLSEKLVERYWNFSRLKSFEDFNKFLEFCTFSNDEVEGMKKNIRSNINWWIDTYAINSFNLEMLQALLKWVYENRVKELEEMTENYITSPRGGLLIIKITENVSKKSLPAIADFFDVWVRHTSNFARIHLLLDGFEKMLDIEFSLEKIRVLLKKKDKSALLYF